MNREHTGGHEWGVGVPLGYSPVYSDETAVEGWEKESLRRLRQIFGGFLTIRFRTMRFGEHLWEVTIEMTGLSGRGALDTQSVSGFSLNNNVFGSHPCDLMRLKDGQKMFVVGMMDNVVRLTFQTGDS
jgi:hypothetical protein